MLKRVDYSTILANLGSTEDEIADLLREQQEDEAADSASHFAMATLEFSPGHPGLRKCDDCGARVLGLPRCECCGARDDRYPF